VWRPPAELSPSELAVIKAVRRAKLLVFLRLHRHELFDEQFQAKLARAYADSPKGQPPVPPAQLALATILQTYTGVSDDEVIEATVMDRRWQLVLDCMGTEGGSARGRCGRRWTRPRCGARAGWRTPLT
jgi:transposase